jgi:hypothetical protein
MSCADFDFMANIYREVQQIIFDRQKLVRIAIKELLDVAAKIDGTIVHVLNEMITRMEEYMNEGDADGDKLVIKDNISLGEMYDDNRKLEKDIIDCANLARHLALIASIASGDSSITVNPWFMSLH